MEKDKEHIYQTSNVYKRQLIANIRCGQGQEERKRNEITQDKGTVNKMQVHYRSESWR